MGHLLLRWNVLWNCERLCKRAEIFYWWLIIKIICLSGPVDTDTCYWSRCSLSPTETPDVYIVERLFSSSLVVVVSTSMPQRMNIYHFKKGTEICNYSYPNNILAVKLNRQVSQSSLPGGVDDEGRSCQILGSWFSDHRIIILLYYDYLMIYFIIIYVFIHYYVWKERKKIKQNQSTQKENERKI